MSHLAVRSLLEDVAKSLADNIQFGYGRETEFNMIEDKRYPYIWLHPLEASRRFVNNNNTTKTTTWNCRLLFLQQDRFDATEKQTVVIHDQLDLTVARYMQTLDDWSLRSTDTVGDITLQNDSRFPFFKGHAGIHSGWAVDFQIVVSDDFEYCTPENISLYAGNI